MTLKKIVNGVCLECTEEEEAALRVQWADADAKALELAPLRQRLSTDDTERLAAKGDAKILALVNATPAQLVSYVRNNFPSLTLAEQNEMAAILYGLAVSLRPHIR